MLDTVLLTSALTLTAIDWGQTRDIVKSRDNNWGCAMNGQVAHSLPTPCGAPRTRYETNPLLGREPSLKSVDRYFPAVMLGTVGLSMVLPAKYSRTFLGSVIVVESLVVMRNHQIGVRISF